MHLYIQLATCACVMLYKLYLAYYFSMLHEVIVIATYVAIFLEQVRFVKDTEERQRILNACHCDNTSGHLGIKKTMSRINERFFWPGLVKDVHELVWCYLHSKYSSSCS